MRDAFELALAFTLEAEGGPSNYGSDQDLGGPTVYGIAAVYHPGIPWPPTLAAATEIYQREYWLANKCDLLPAAWGIALFEHAVNPGAASARRSMQMALGVTADGAIGPKTIAAAERGTSWQLGHFIGLRCNAWRSSPVVAVNFVGWASRAARLAAYIERHAPILGLTGPDDAVIIRT